MAKPIPKKIIKAVLERDESICQHCGRQGVNIHHIVPAGMGGKRIHAIENLITLCLDCHSGAHGNREMREFTYEWSRRLYGDVIDKLLELKWSNEKG
jgi:5-methylcytosine-specific restriction endonuclease McrA